MWQFPSDASFVSWTSSSATSLHELVAISSTPLPIPAALTQLSAASTSEIGIIGGSTVPPEHVARIQSHLDSLKFSPAISRLLAKVPAADIEADVLYLSGEAQVGATAETSWVSRHSMSEGAHKASKWLLARFEAYGLTCDQHRYRYGFAPMVACSVVGTEKPDEIVVIGAHFDSRGSFGYPGAPGADDDASGTSMLLALAREIQRNKLSFSRTVVIAAFSGEEQGLLASKWYSQMLKDAGADVYLMIQQDMLAYKKAGEPLQLGFPDKIGLDEAKWLVGNVSTLYAPELVVGETAACCSDHQYFDQLGFASTWVSLGGGRSVDDGCACDLQLPLGFLPLFQVFERNGPIADPMYHNSGDLVRREGCKFRPPVLLPSSMLEPEFLALTLHFPSPPLCLRLDRADPRRPLGHLRHRARGGRLQTG